MEKGRERQDRRSLVAVEPNRKQQTPGLQEGLNRRQHLPVYSHGPQSDDVNRIVKLRPRKQLLESRRHRPPCGPAPGCARLRAGTQPFASSTRPSASRCPARRASSESPAIHPRNRVEHSRIGLREVIWRPGQALPAACRSPHRQHLRRASDVSETLRFHFRSSSKYALETVK